MQLIFNMTTKKRYVREFISMWALTTESSWPKISVVREYINNNINIQFLIFKKSLSAVRTTGFVK